MVRMRWAILGSESARPVTASLGPMGLLGMIQQPQFTKDGVSIASLAIQNPLEEAIKQAIIQGAKETNDAAGDGTTTATALIQARKRHQKCDSWLKSNGFKRGIDLAVAKVVEQLKEISTNCDSDESIAHVATISAITTPSRSINCKGNQSSWPSRCCYRRRR